MTTQSMKLRAAQEDVPCGCNGDEVIYLDVHSEAISSEKYDTLTDEEKELWEAHECTCKIEREDQENKEIQATNSTL